MGRQDGFTLLEILLAMTLATLLLSSIYGVFSTTSSAKERIEEKSSELHIARVFANRLNREFLGGSLAQEEDTPFLVGGRNSQGEPFVQVLTSSSGYPRPGLRWVRYRLGDDFDERVVLWRSEWGEYEQEEGREERFAQGIESLEFSFFDGSSWYEEWDSSVRGRPLLVKTELTLSDRGEPEVLSSVFQLPQEDLK